MTTTQRPAHCAPRTAPAERPILFSAPMVRALLDNRKTQTRRIVKGAAGAFWDHGAAVGHSDWKPTVVEDAIRWADGDGHVFSMPKRNPYGQPGDRLWVREAWRRPHCAPRTALEPGQVIQYRASGDWHDGFGEGWRPSIHMPRWASRLTLEITSIRVERVQDITEEDIVAEGWPVVYEWLHSSSKRLDDWCAYTRRTDPTATAATKRGGFALFWDSINGKGSWSSNPWLWVVGFKRLTPASTPQPGAEVSTRSRASTSSRRAGSTTP